MAYTVQQVIDIILSTIPGAPREGTLDTLKSGCPGWEVSGIVSTFTATRAVLNRAVELGANMVITHEGTFYNHPDDVDWLEGDPVYESKRRFLEEHRLAVWRFHEYWHGNRGGRPDGIMTGVERRLGWEGLADPPESRRYSIPATTLAGLAALLEERLGFGFARAVGDPDMPCRRVAILEGYGSPGQRQMQVIGRADVDVLVCGETFEWETCEYVRDAAAAGQRKGMLVIGHRNSEEAGMEYLVEWLRPRVPGVEVTFVEAGDPFIIL